MLYVGRFFEPSYYPDIDVSAGGSALKWIDALEEVIDSVPLLISAIPPEEPEEEDEKDDETAETTAADEDEVEEEKTLEEMVSVIPARGEVTNLQVMKDMLDISKKLRKGITGAVKSGESCEQYLDSPNADSFRVYGNFFTYAGQLCREISEGEY